MRINNSILSVVILCQIVGFRSFADDSVVHLDKNQAAPFDGFLLSPERTQKVHLMQLNYQQALDNDKYLTDTNAIYAKRLENITTENDKLATQLSDARDTSIWTKIGFFLLGSIISGGIAVGVSRLSK